MKNNADILIIIIQIFLAILIMNITFIFTPLILYYANESYKPLIYKGCINYIKDIENQNISPSLKEFYINLIKNSYHCQNLFKNNKQKDG
jgi:predicted phosphoadenosine phosphosulfate sulfurtransferase